MPTNVGFLARASKFLRVSTCAFASDGYFFAAMNNYDLFLDPMTKAV